jgi:hypothetical protein
MQGSNHLTFEKNSQRKMRDEFTRRDDKKRDKKKKEDYTENRKNKRERDWS